MACPALYGLPFIAPLAIPVLRLATRGRFDGTVAKLVAGQPRPPGLERMRATQDTDQPPADAEVETPAKLVGDKV